ncbi:MAG TPA: indolepyruvate ferredoxin oxidoreductase subunit alpha [Candidatus Limiplasma sp.]|nr:indolepyruvate ferredoxin oxidoreductase subunit alpha [Candidatus Limiplasma sp.]
MQKYQQTEQPDATLLLGNQAIARGAWEAGVRVVTSYPGTPSTEITEAAAKYSEINTQWGSNEKVAMEVAFGAAMAGARAMTCMKHVGMNVAADPLFTSAYTGITAGMVIVVADDPAMHSSQNEQDSRYYARAAHIPMLEPADSQECKDFTRLAFQMSEELDTPVIIRLTTRIAHARSLVTELPREEAPVKPYEKKTQKYVMMPGMARKRHLLVEQREHVLAESVNTLPVNEIEMRSQSLGVITSGVCYQYVRDALPEASVLKLGMVYPLPMLMIEAFSRQVDRLIVIEELEGLIEKDIKAAGIACEGKSLTGIQGELDVDRIKNAVLGTPMPAAAPVDLPNRPPTLCPGCPHRGIFYELNKLKLHVMGDIGCYTLAALPPLSAMDACLCMGASIGMASGAERAQGKEFSKKTVAVLGDSTFIHSGITGLIDAVYGQEAITVLILDNRITGMTGHQQNPATGFDIHNNPAPMLDLEALCKGCGVEHVVVVDPLNLEETKRALQEETARDAVSVIIARRPCALIDKTKRIPYHTESCKNCGACLKVSCQAIERKGDHVEINASLCTGCGMCAQVCPFDAIVKGDDAQ